MKPIHVKAFVESNSAHTTQFYTGLYMLQEQGEVSVSLAGGKFTNDGYIRLLVNDKPVFIDLADHSFIDDKQLEESKFYFKRMLLKADAAKELRLQPYGLNYPVYNRNDRFFLRSLFSRNPKFIFKSLLRTNTLLASISQIDLSYLNANMESIAAEPLESDEPKVIFSARLWWPGKGKSVDKRHQREAMNRQRIEIVLEARNRLGNNFIGGIDKTDYAASTAPEALVSNDSFSYKKSYLRVLKQCSIGIANPGLEHSIGFKLAEYVCMSKAIVTSSLKDYLLPGNFAENTHYLTFDETASDCINKCEQLIEDKKLRQEIMHNNNIYYQQYLRPDMLVKNILDKVA